MHAFVIIRRNSLECYFSERDDYITTAIPKTAISDMEVVNEGELTKAITQSFGAPVRPVIPTVIAMSDELCFALPLTPEQETQGKIAEVVPFSRVATTIIRSESSSVMVATNQDLYETILRILNTLGYSTVLVLPWSAIPNAGIGRDGILDKNIVRRLFDSLQVLKKTSFSMYSASIEPTQAKPPVQAHPQAQQVRKIAWGWIVFGLGALIYAIFMIVRILR